MTSFPIPEREQERLHVLRALDILDSPRLPGLQNLCDLACEIFDAPVAFVSLVDADRQWFKAQRGVDLSCTDRSAAFCAHTILSDDLLVVPDATQDPRFAHSPLVTGAPAFRFYAGAPVAPAPGLPVGAFCIVDLIPRAFGERQRRQLRSLAAAAVEQLKLYAIEARTEQVERRGSFIESAASAGSWERDLETGKLLWSDGIYQLYDLDPDAAPLDFEAIVRRLHADDRDAALAAVLRAREARVPFHIRYRIVRSDGEVRWLEASSHIVADEARRSLRQIGTVIDVTDRCLAEEKLARREARYRAVAEAGSTAIWRTDAGGSFLEGWGWTEYTGQPMDLAQGTGWLERVHPDDLPRLLACSAAAIATGARFEAEYRLRRADGACRWVAAHGVPLRDADGSIREWVGTVADIDEQRERADKLRLNEERLELALDAGGMVAWDLDRRTGSFIQSGRVLGVYGFDAATHVDYLDRIHPDDVDAVRAAIDGAVPGAMARAECRFLRPDGETVWLEFRCVQLAAAEEGRIVGVTFDITQRKRAEERVWYAANHDPLTGLPNRARFNGRLDAMLADARRAGTGAALLLIDLDDFKGINDTLGHDAGDTVLEAMAKRLRSTLGDTDLVARLGGDEFAIAVPGLSDHAEVLALCGRVLSEMRRPVDYRERTVAVRASLGVALFPDHDEAPAELMKDADMALYSAKAAGGNRAVFYSPEMRRIIERRVGIAAELRQALLRDEIVPFYQPKVCLASGRVEGFEALARWRHPVRGLLGPSSFASAFEDRELSSAIGSCMMRKVVADLRAWRQRGMAALPVAVNLSAAELCDADLAGRLLGLLAEADIRPGLFEVEITESVVLGPAADQVQATLQQLHEAGVTTALDDFGTGHASLTHLKQLSIDNIKIDRSFIRDVLDDAEDAAIVGAVIGLAKNLGMKSIAEGVETAAQIAFLLDRGCDQGQGYLFAKPMPGEEVQGFVAGYLVDSADLLIFPPRSVA